MNLPYRTPVIDTLRTAAANTPGLPEMQKIRLDAESISRSLASIHGDGFKVVIGLDFSFVAVMRDR